MSYVRELTKEEYEQILDALDQHQDHYLYRRTKIGEILELISRTGMRLRTAVNLRKGDVRFEEGYYVDEFLPKSKQFKRIPIPAELGKRYYYESGSGEPIFEGYKKRNEEKSPMTPRAVEKVVKEVSESLGIYGVNTRSFYHYYEKSVAEDHQNK